MTRRHRGRDRDAPHFDSFAGAGDPRAGMLASQVEEALRLSLALLDDPRLDGARLVGVGHQGGTLVATVEAPPAQLVAVGAALARAMPRIRYDLAGEVHRKRLPVVRFAVVPTVSEEGG